MPSHHLHHQIVQRYKEYPESLHALVEGLRTGDLPETEFEYLAKFLEPDMVDGRIAGDYQPDFPLLVLFGYADRLACRGPHNTTSIPDTARTDLAVLAFWALYPDVRSRCLKRKLTCEHPSRVIKRLSDRLRQKSGKDEQEWETLGADVLGKLRRWYHGEKQARNASKKSGPLLYALLAQGVTILEEVMSQSKTRLDGASVRPGTPDGSSERMPRIPSAANNNNGSELPWIAWPLSELGDSPLRLHPGALRARQGQPAEADP